MFFLHEMLQHGKSFITSFTFKQLLSFMNCCKITFQVGFKLFMRNSFKRWQMSIFVCKTVPLFLIGASISLSIFHVFNAISCTTSSGWAPNFVLHFGIILDNFYGKKVCNSFIWSLIPPSDVWITTVTPKRNGLDLLQYCQTELFQCFLYLVKIFGLNKRFRRFLQ